MAKPQRSPAPPDWFHGRYAWFVLLPLFVLLAWIYLPVTRGDFVADDYVFLATARMVDAPLAAFWQSHFYEPYYFRPIGVLSWWLATLLFGLDYSAHSLINFILHCVNAGLLFWLLRALALRASAAVAGVLLFTLGPFALATILWPSNRFDLLAIAFLLGQAIAMVRALQGNVFAFPLAMLATLGACWSKESAYAISTMMCFVALAASGESWRRRGSLFVLLGAVIAGAFFWRHRIVSDAYAIASADPVGQVTDGAQTMLMALPRLVELIVGAPVMPWFAGGVLGACLIALIWRRRDVKVSLGLIGGVLLVLLAAVVVQTPLAKAFAPMLDGGPFGTVTFARFYYAPWLVLSVAVALVLARGRFADIGSVMVVAVTVAASLGAEPLAETFAEWTRREVKPMSVAATKLVDAEGVAPCVYVLLGTQERQPYFRMFSDVTVKARTVSPERTWRCQVMTESTPWLFAFPFNIDPLELPLRTIDSADGKAKPDSVWSSIRYRYRLPTKDLARLPGARFFEWRDGRFVEVTKDVRSGTRKVMPEDW
ncbi:MAG: hypothetical protein ABIZ64_02560 [Casimicrobium sp.]